MKKTTNKAETTCYIAAGLLGILLAMYVRCGRGAEYAERDYGRTCLALVEYLEARSDGAEGMREVGRVVLRRLDSHRWGEDICAVVSAPGQFEAWETHPPPRHPEREPDAWALAQTVAGEVLAEHFDGENDAGYCQGALFFSQNERPTALCKVGVHFFYQSNQ